MMICVPLKPNEILQFYTGHATGYNYVSQNIKITNYNYASHTYHRKRSN